MPSESRSVIRPPRDISSLAIAVRCPIRQRASVSYGVTSYVGPASRVNAVARYTPMSCHRTHPDKIMTTTHPWAARDEPITTPIHFVIRLSLRRAQFASIEAEVRQAILEVAESATYVLGPKVAAFERAFAQYHGARHC